MGWYSERVLPCLIHSSMRQETFAAYRQRLLCDAEGRVLEIGVGSGLNFQFYAGTTTQVIGVDPAEVAVDGA